jgi:hypothetical protein
MTAASQHALAQLRDPGLLQWYVIPLLAIAVYIYAVEVERRNWSLFFCGLAFWGMDWLNEIANSVVLHATGYSPLWVEVGPTAYQILVGLNYETAFLFAIAGIGLGKMLPKDPKLRILGVPNRLFFAITSSCFCVFVEVLLNRAGVLLWAWRFWDVPHLWSIVIGGYLHFHLVAFWVHDMPTVRQQALVTGAIYAVAALGVAVFGFGFGWL